MTQNRKPVALAIGATLAGGLMLSGSAFASTPLAQGYLLGALEAGTADKAKEGSCGADKAKEGKCGVAATESDKDGQVSRAEFDAAHVRSDEHTSELPTLMRSSYAVCCLKKTISTLTPVASPQHTDRPRIN